MKPRSNMMGTFSLEYLAQDHAEKIALAYDFAI
jgi:hypothetical protein